jgi:hypothetical protein
MNTQNIESLLFYSNNEILGKKITLSLKEYDFNYFHVIIVERKSTDYDYGIKKEIFRIENIKYFISITIKYSESDKDVKAAEIIIYKKLQFVNFFNKQITNLINCVKLYAELCDISFKFDEFDSIFENSFENMKL